MVLIFEIHKDFVHERLCKFTPEIEANRNLSFLFTYVGVIANEPAERRRSAGEAAENSAARRMVYAKKFSIGIEKCKCKV